MEKGNRKPIIQIKTPIKILMMICFAKTITLFMKLRRLFLLKLLQYDDWFVQKHLHVAYISQQKYSFNFRLLHTLNKKKNKKKRKWKVF